MHVLLLVDHISRQTTAQQIPAVMGACLSLCGGQDEGKYVKQELSASPQAPVSKKDKAAHREQGWRATGIIGLRDQGLNLLPSTIASVGEAARVLDATNNQLGRLNAAAF
jgi:hypothetical protein